MLTLHGVSAAFSRLTLCCVVLAGCWRWVPMARSAGWPATWIGMA